MSILLTPRLSNLLSGFLRFLVSVRTRLKYESTQTEARIRGLEMWSNEERNSEKFNLLCLDNRFKTDVEINLKRNSYEGN